MKRSVLYSLLTFVLFLLSISVSADKVSKSAAWSMAQPYMKSQSSMARSMVRTPMLTDDDSQPLYIFSRGEGEGFVIVSGDDCLPSIIGYTESGDYDEDNMPPALKAIIEHYAEAVKEAQAAGINKPYASVTSSSYDKDIPVLLTSHWHQNGPWNDLCPQRSDGGGRAVTGCVATAAAQIAYYWRNEGLNGVTQYDTPTYSYGGAPVTSVIVKKGTPFEWDLMADRSTTSSGNAAMARLCVLMGTCAWLTYGASTGGLIYNMQDVFQNQIGMTRGEYVKKSNYSQIGWEKLVISDLILGRPILYASYNYDKESGDGHAYVVDGYRTSDNTFHINFGWGDGHDGYFTMAETTRSAMGNRPDDQQMVYKLYSPNIDRKFSIEPQSKPFYRDVKNVLHFKAENNSSMPVKGLYFFSSKEKELPSTTKIEKAFASFDVTLNKGDILETDVEFVTGLYSTDLYFYVTDENMGVLYRTEKTVPVERSEVSVKLQDVSVVNNGGEEKTFMYNGEQMSRMVYNVQNSNIVQMNVTISNNLSASGVCMPAITAIVSAVDEQGTCTEVATQTNRDSLFMLGDTKVLPLEISGLEEGKLYKVSIAPTVQNYQKSRSYYSLEYDGAELDSVVFFVLTGSDVTVERNGGHVSVSGSSYEPNMVKELFADATVTSYDFRGYKAKMSTGFTTANPNAIVYLNSEDGITGANVVVDGVCEEVKLQTGYDYDPTESFTAKKATCFVECTPCPKSSYIWNTVVLPFTVDTPNGILARKFIDDTYTDVSNAIIQAGVPYIYLALDDMDRFYAENVEVLSLKDMGGSMVSGKFIGTFSNVVSDGTLCIAEKRALSEAAKGTIIPTFTCYRTESLDLRNTVSIPDVDNSMHSFVRKCKTARSKLEELRAERSAIKIATFEKAISEAEHSLTLLPDVAADIDEIANVLVAAQKAYENPALRGDANGDGEVGMSDIMFIVNYILGSPAEAFDADAADANLDGEVGMPDVMFIVQYILNGKFPDE